MCRSVESVDGMFFNMNEALFSLFSAAPDIIVALKFGISASFSNFYFVHAEASQASKRHAGGGPQAQGL